MPESSDHEEFGNSNLWFPDSCGPRGSQWQSALPTGSKWQSALPTGSKWQSALPTGCQPCRYAQTPFICSARVCASQALALFRGLLESFTSTFPSLSRPVSTMKWPV